MRGLGVEAPAVVGRRANEPSASVTLTCTRRVCVPDHVGEGLLDEAVERGFELGGRGARRVAALPGLVEVGASISSPWSRR